MLTGVALAVGEGALGLGNNGIRSSKVSRRLGACSPAVALGEEVLCAGVDELEGVLGSAAAIFGFTGLVIAAWVDAKWCADPVCPYE